MISTSKIERARSIRVPESWPARRPRFWGAKSSVDARKCLWKSWVSAGVMRVARDEPVRRRGVRPRRGGGRPQRPRRLPRPPPPRPRRLLGALGWAWARSASSNAAAATPTSSPRRSSASSTSTSRRRSSSTSSPAGRAACCRARPTWCERCRCARRACRTPTPSTGTARSWSTSCLALFDDHFPSFRLGLAKPDAAIFARRGRVARACRRRRVVFIDDNQVNVDAAASVGIVARAHRRPGAGAGGAQRAARVGVIARSCAAPRRGQRRRSRRRPTRRAPPATR